MNVTIGKGAHVSVWNGSTGQNINGDIAVGPNAHAWNGEYTYQNAKGSYLPRIGNKEYLLDFGQGAVEAVKDSWKFDFIKKTNYKVADGSKIAGSIAIGKNTVARTGSVMLGDHSYTGKLGDIEINPANAMTYNNGIYSTTLGAGAYNSGSLAAVTGALSIASGKGDKDARNTGATIYGSMNSIESATSDSSYSGVASSVLGFANRTQNANAALIWGTGNEVTNYVEDIGIDTNWNKLSVAEAQQKAIEAMQSSKYAGGSVMAIGGGNKADYATYSQLTGVQNKVTGTKTKAAKYDFVNGYQNTVTKASDVTVIGSKNEVTADGNKVIGDNHKVSGKNNVIFGSADKLTETTVHNSVALGHNAKVTGEGGVALGFGSVADRGNAVSVGNAKLNRQITNVAEGVEDTDAVNVSQLKKATANANKGWKLSTEGGTANQVASEATVDFSGQKDAGNHQNITVSNEGNNVKIDLASELHNITGVVNGKSRVTLGTGIAGITNGQESVIMKNGSTTINGVVGIDKNGKITGVANGEADKDAVNYGQLKDVKAEAGKHTTLSDGKNTTVESTVKDGQTDYKVNVAGDLIDITSVANGGAKLALNGAAGVAGIINGKGASVYLQDGYTKINNKVIIDQDGKISGVAAGTADKDAVNYGQLKDVKAEAGKHTTLSDGKNTTVESTVKDGQTDYKVNVAGDLIDITSVANGGAKLALNGAAGVAGIINGKGASVYLQDGYTKINNKVIIDQDGKISGVAAGKISADSTDAVNGSQLNKVSEIANKGWNLATNGVATEATNVKPGDYVDFSGDKNISVSHDGTKVKVELNKDLDVNSVQTNALNAKYNLSVGTMAENGIMPFFVNSTGAFYAAHNKFSVDKDGNMNANSVQTNALNSKYNLSVGTANENGTVPFFVNSNGAFYAANGKLVVDKDGKVTATAGEIGNVVLNNGVFTGNSALRDGELFVGDASGNYSQITTKGAKLGKVTIAEDGKISGVAAGEVSSTSTDAINGSQLHQTNENVAQNKADIAANRADIDKNKADIAANRADIDKNKADIAANRADIDKNKADIAQNKADIAQNKADIAQNKADIAQNKTDIKNLGDRVTNVEELAKKHTTVTAGDNITVTEDTNKDGGKEYKVALDKDIKLDSVTTGQTVMNNDGLKVGDKVSVTKDAVTAGKTSISDEGVKVGDKTYISDKGLNANGQQITNVADGKENGDAVNYGQLKGVENQVVSNTNRINQLGSRVNKVGAGAAALAALHPMDFDPDDKLTFSAGYGNYGGENAAAIGAYYRPDEKVMFSVGGTVGNGENMVNAGVSFSLDRTNHVSNSRTAMAREILDLRAEVTELKAMVAKGGLGSIAEDKMKIFPDVAENHWAYEYVGKLAAAGIIEGYPDGNFSGDRMMSRYEFAAMLYRAMQKGAQLDSKIINEFAPEMGRIRVDRISGEDGDRDKIERVRVNAVKGERDHYGSKVAKKASK